MHLLSRSGSSGTGYSFRIVYYSLLLGRRTTKSGALLFLTVFFLLFFLLLLLPTITQSSDIVSTSGFRPNVECMPKLFGLNFVFRYCVALRRNIAHHNFPMLFLWGTYMSLSQPSEVISTCGFHYPIRSGPLFLNFIFIFRNSNSERSKIAKNISHVIPIVEILKLSI